MKGKKKKRASEGANTVKPCTSSNERSPPRAEAAVVVLVALPSLMLARYAFGHQSLPKVVSISSPWRCTSSENHGCCCPVLEECSTDALPPKTPSPMECHGEISRAVRGGLLYPLCVGRRLRVPLLRVSLSESY